MYSIESIIHTFALAFFNLLFIYNVEFVQWDSSTNHPYSSPFGHSSSSSGTSSSESLSSSSNASLSSSSQSSSSSSRSSVSSVPSPTSSTMSDISSDSQKRRGKGGPLSAGISRSVGSGGAVRGGPMKSFSSSWDTQQQQMHHHHHHHQRENLNQDGSGGEGMGGVEGPDTHNPLLGGGKK
jgi:hypothetical protein